MRADRPTFPQLVLDTLVDRIAGEPASYLFIAAIVAVDGLLPLVPGETVVIGGGILSANGKLALLGVIAAAAVGAAAGDNLSYGVGRLAGRPMAARLFGSVRSRRRLEWAREQLAERGPVIIVVARFIPGGRTATTFAAGTLEMPWRRFVTPDSLAAVLWAAEAALLGFLGGEAFRESLWKPLVVALVVAAVVGFAGELVRRRYLTGTGPADRAGRPPG